LNLYRITSYDVWTQKTKLVENKCPVSIDDIEEAYLKADKAKLDAWRKSLESLKKSSSDKLDKIIEVSKRIT